MYALQHFIVTPNQRPIGIIHHIFIGVPCGNRNTKTLVKIYKRLHGMVGVVVFSDEFRFARRQLLRKLYSDLVTFVDNRLFKCIESIDVQETKCCRSAIPSVCLADLPPNLQERT